jgi:hypothetical protein
LKYRFFGLCGYSGGGGGVDSQSKKSNLLGFEKKIKTTPQKFQISKNQNQNSYF